MLNLETQPCKQTSLGEPRPSLTSPLRNVHPKLDPCLGVVFACSSYFSGLGGGWMGGGLLEEWEKWITLVGKMEQKNKQKNYSRQSAKGHLIIFSLSFFHFLF